MPFDLKIKKKGEESSIGDYSLSEEDIAAKLWCLRNWLLVFKGKIFRSIEEIDTIRIFEKNYDYTRNGWYFVTCHDEHWRRVDDFDLSDLDDDLFTPSNVDVSQELLERYFFSSKGEVKNQSVVEYKTKDDLLIINSQTIKFTEWSDPALLLKMVFDKSIKESIDFIDALNYIERVERMDANWDKRMRNCIDYTNRVIAKKCWIKDFLWVKEKALYRNY